MLSSISLQRRKKRTSLSASIAECLSQRSKVAKVAVALFMGQKLRLMRTIAAGSWLNGQRLMVHPILRLLKTTQRNLLKEYLGVLPQRNPASSHVGFNVIAVGLWKKVHVVGSISSLTVYRATSILTLTSNLMLAATRRCRLRTTAYLELTQLELEF